MLRNRRSPNDFMRNDGMYPSEPRVQSLPPVSQLDAQTERLAEQAEDIGWLKGQNDLLNEDNRRLETANQKLEERVAELHRRNVELERQESAASAAYKSGSQLVEEIEEALSARKSTK